MSMTQERPRGGGQVKSPAQAFLTFNAKSGQMFLSYRGGEGKTAVTSIEGFIVDDAFQSVGGGKMGSHYIESNKGYNWKTKFNVYRREQNAKEGSKIAEGGWRDIKDALKPQGAKIVWHPMGYLISVNGQPCDPIIFEMTVYGMNNHSYGERLKQINRPEGSGCRFSITEFETVVDKKFKNESKIPVWNFIYCKDNEANKKFWDLGLQLDAGPVGDFREALMARNDFAADTNADAPPVNDWGSAPPPQTAQQNFGQQQQSATPSGAVPPWVTG